MKATLKFLFKTSESDSYEVYKDNEGNFFAKRYGIPMKRIDNEFARYLAWGQLNREGHFPCSIGSDGIKRITLTEAQQNMHVNFLLS